MMEERKAVPNSCEKTQGSTLRQAEKIMERVGGNVDAENQWEFLFKGRDSERKTAEATRLPSSCRDGEISRSGARDGLDSRKA